MAAEQLTRSWPRVERERYTPSQAPKKYIRELRHEEVLNGWVIKETPHPIFFQRQETPKRGANVVAIRESPEITSEIFAIRREFVETLNKGEVLIVEGDAKIDVDGTTVHRKERVRFAHADNITFPHFIYGTVEGDVQQKPVVIPLDILDQIKRT